MIKNLIKQKNELYYYENNNKIISKNKNMSGYCSELSGNCTELSGYCTRLSGDCSGLSGDLDNCNITKEEREKCIKISDLIKED